MEQNYVTVTLSIGNTRKNFRGDWMYSSGDTLAHRLTDKRVLSAGLT